jgi:hypothetical protein
MPLKKGWRTLPSADFARYSIFGQQRRLYPNSPVRDLLGIGLVFSDQRLHSQLQILGGCRVKAMIDLAGIDQVVALPPSKVEPFKFAAIKRIRRWSVSRAGHRFC